MSFVILILKTKMAFKMAFKIFLKKNQKQNPPTNPFLLGGDTGLNISIFFSVSYLVIYDYFVIIYIKQYQMNDIKQLHISFKPMLTRTCNYF